MFSDVTVRLSVLVYVFQCYYTFIVLAYVYAVVWSVVSRVRRRSLSGFLRRRDLNTTHRFTGTKAAVRNRPIRLAFG